MNSHRLIISLGCAAPFIGTYFIVPRYTLPFDFYDHYFIFIIIHIYHLANFKSLKILPSWFLKGLALLFMGTLIASFYADALNFNFLKQILGIIFSASSYFIVFKLAKLNLYFLFNRYLFFAFIASILALIEEGFHLIGVHLRSDFKGSLGLYRVSALSGEPYNLAMVLVPAVFFILLSYLTRFSGLNRNWINSLVRNITILLAFFLTFSSTGYTGLFLSFILIAAHTGFLNFKSARIFFFPVFMTVVYLLFNFLSTSDKMFERKVDEGLWFLKSEDDMSIKDFNRLNSSTFALASNYQITTDGFKENPLFGVGLGNYELLYHKKFDRIFGRDFETKYGRSNYNDANSMFLRLVAETGIWGTALFILFLICFMIKRFSFTDLNEFYLISINHAVLILFIIRLMRCGNYISDGSFFFILFYYYCYQLHRQFYKE